MKKNILKKTLSENKQTYGCWVTIPHILIPEILAPARFEWLVVDMEHSSIEFGDFLPLIISIENNDLKLNQFLVFSLYSIFLGDAACRAMSELKGEK